MNVKPTKKSEKHTAMGHHVHTVKHSRLASGEHSSIFPKHAAGMGSFHSGHRNGHGGTETSPSRKSK